MAKKKNPIARIVMWIVSLVVVLAVGGLFASGTTTGFPILSWIPSIVHTIVGWGIIILALIGAILDALGLLF